MRDILTKAELDEALDQQTVRLTIRLGLLVIAGAIALITAMALMPK